LTGASTTSNSIEMVFPPNWIGKYEMRPCGLNDIPLNEVKRAREGVSSREPKYFQQDKDITYVEAPSSTTIFLITYLA